MEKEKTEADARKLQNLILEYAKEKETEQQQKKISNNLTSQSSSQGAASSSSIKLGLRQNDLLFSNDDSSNLFNKQTSVYDYLRMFFLIFNLVYSLSLCFNYKTIGSSSSAINTLESLQSKLKEKDGEIVQLQVGIKC